MCIRDRMTGVLKIDHIREKSDFLLANMAFFFIPAGVNVINYLDILKANWLPLLLICVITTVITFAATTYSIRLTIWLLGRRKGADRRVIYFLLLSLESRSVF